MASTVDHRSAHDRGVHRTSRRGEPAGPRRAGLPVPVLRAAAREGARLPHAGDGVLRHLDVRGPEDRARGSGDLLQRHHDRAARRGGGGRPRAHVRRAPRRDRLGPRPDPAAHGSARAQPLPPADQPRVHPADGEGHGARASSARPRRSSTRSSTRAPATSSRSSPSRCPASSSPSRSGWTPTRSRRSSAGPTRCCRPRRACSSTRRPPSTTPRSRPRRSTSSPRCSRRGWPSPTGDLMSALVAESADGDAPLTMAELQNIMNQLVTGGYTTTADAIANAMLLLIEHPDQMELLRNDRSLLRSFADEVPSRGELRAGPVPSIDRRLRAERRAHPGQQHPAHALRGGQPRRGRVPRRRRGSTSRATTRASTCRSRAARTSASASRSRCRRS